MKGNLTKITLSMICLCSFSFANENIKRSLEAKNLQHDVKKYNISKDVIESIQNKAINDIGNSLNINTSMFNKNRKFSLFVKVSRNSKFGFRYKF